MYTEGKKVKKFSFLFLLLYNSMKNILEIQKHSFILVRPSLFSRKVSFRNITSKVFLKDQKDIKTEDKKLFNEFLNTITNAW